MALETRSSINALVVVAHPDDEVLGCGAAGAALVNGGATFRACILCGDAEARSRRPETAALRDDTLRAQQILGFGDPFLGTFPNIALNAVPHLELVHFIEQAILDSGATTILTHHPRDLNNDHLQVSLACQAAVQVWRRRVGVPPVERVLLMETLSSTDWSLPDGRMGFDPNYFVGVDNRWIDRKIEALASYRSVMRPAPHSRSAEIVRALAATRGAQCGTSCAEGFEAVFQRINAVSG